MNVNNEKHQIKTTEISLVDSNLIMFCDWSKIATQVVIVVMPNENLSRSRDTW